MATCEPAPLALDWLAARRRWLVVVVGVAMVAGPAGAIAVAHGWTARAAWLAGAWAAIVLALRIDGWRYGRFLAATDRAWIASLGRTDLPPSGRLPIRELRERLSSDWGRAGRWPALPDAVDACQAWIAARRGLRIDDDLRELLGLLCGAIREAGPHLPAAEAEACLARVRGALLGLDLGAIGDWRAAAD